MIKRKSAKAQLTVQKEKVEFLGTVLGLVNKAAIGMGALVTFAYLYLIHYFPAGLTPGEVIFFVFIALAFSFTYLVFLAYAAFTILWITHVLTVLSRATAFNYRKNKLSGSRFSEFAARVRQRKHASWPRKRGRLREAVRAFRRQMTRSAIQNKTMVPPQCKGWFPGLLSFVSFLYLISMAIQIGSIRFWEVVFALGISGFVVLILSHAPIQRQKKIDQLALRFFGVLVLPLVLICIYAGPALLLEMAFEGMGLRIQHVSIEIPVADAGMVERTAEHIQRPLIDCRRPQSDKILVHGADVLWSGVGEQTVVQFSGRRVERKTLFAPDLDDIRQVVLRFDSKSIRILKFSPQLDPCFDLPSDLLFETGSYTLAPTAMDRIKKLIASIKEAGEPMSIVVTGHSDPRQIAKSLVDNRPLDNQRLSELRAAAIAEAIQHKAAIPGLNIRSQGMGSRSLKIRCEEASRASKYEIEQCNAPNRRVEVQVAYRRSGPTKN